MNDAIRNDVEENKIMKRVIIFSFIILLLSCFLTKKRNIQWTHSQIVGHDFLNNREYSTVGAYFIVEGGDSSLNSSYTLSFGEKNILITESVKSDKKKLTALKLYLRDIDKLLGEEILDSVEFKNRFSERLKNSNLIINSTNKKIPKSKSYKLIYGYRLKRIL